MTDSSTPINATDAKPRPGHVPLTRSPLRKYFQAAVQHGASDLLMRGGQQAKLRLHGALKSLDAPPLDIDVIKRAVDAALSDEQKGALDRHGSVDLGVNLDHDDGQTYRFRVNVFRTRNRLALAARQFNSAALDFEQLHLPPVMRRIAETHRGLVLVAGGTGSGKSTTIASILQHINTTRPCHILTIEDPIEYVFAEDQALINQREVGQDVPSFAQGLRALVRENPDVVLIGELRDRPAFEAAIQAAETGHLVFGTLHAPSASQIFGRVYDMFPAPERAAVRNLLAYQLQAVVFQKLLATGRQDVGRVPAVEVLLQSAAMRSYILDGREHELDQVIKSERDDGMQSFADGLLELVNRQLIHPRTALAAAANPAEMQMRLKGIKTV